MAVITVSRETGSNGTYIARKVARTLGYQLVDKRTIGSLLGQYGLVEFSKIYDTIPDFWQGFDMQKVDQREHTISMMNRTVLALARHGNLVIMGRGSYLVLDKFVDVLNVRIQAPLDVRVKRVLEEEKKTDMKETEAKVKEEDRIREQFIVTAYGTRWENAKPFDLVINTAKVPSDLACEWIVNAVKALPMQKPAENSTGGIVVDKTLADAVTSILQLEREEQENKTA